METMKFSYEAEKTVARHAHVGVVGSGDLEILLEPSKELIACIVIRTGFNGYKEIWKNILDRFFMENKVAVNLTINDFGATPGMVALRLRQVLEVADCE